MKITDTDYNTQGVTKYRVYAKIGAPATEADPYQEVTAPGSYGIDLSALSIYPANADPVHFLVVAFDADGRKSTPTVDDRSSVSWDMEGPNQPTGLTLVDNGDGTMKYLWSDQSTDDDLDHFVVYFNKGAEATPTNGAIMTGPYLKNYKGNNLLSGNNYILDRLGAQNGDVIHVTVYAVDQYGNQSEPAKASEAFSGKVLAN